MKHFSYLTAEQTDKIFFQEPIEFYKKTEKSLLAYALGATLYMPGTRVTIAFDILQQKYNALTSVVICLEDAIGDSALQLAEDNVYMQLLELQQAIDNQLFDANNIPLLFIRVRSPEHLQRLVDRLGPLQHLLTGYNFPKADITAHEYFAILKKVHRHQGIKLYGMPIIEKEILWKPKRIAILEYLIETLAEYHEYVLNLRIGGTDLCGGLGVRRTMDKTIYDIVVVREIIGDILGVFQQLDIDNVVSGCVWEFFSKEANLGEPHWLSEPSMEGLINEVKLDKLNGIVGKTIIHPTHIIPVNALYVVTKEEYVDAQSILENCHGTLGVIKSGKANKMNEIRPHFIWAQKIIRRATMYGVFHDGVDVKELLFANNQAMVTEGVRE